MWSRFGVEVERDPDWRWFQVRGGQHYTSPATVYVEGDASSASYFLAGAAATGGTVTVEGCGGDSLQVREGVTWRHARVAQAGPRSHS